jgi:NADH-quinone oxidoreductase subunit J
MNSLAAQIAFYSLAAMTLIPALCVVRARSIVHAGFWLLPCFVGVAGLYAALEAHFFFVVQLLIYAGAILILILFALMLTRDAMNPRVPQTNRMGFLGGLIAAACGLTASTVLMQQGWPLKSAAPADAAAQTQALGDALIGAVVLAKTEREPEPETPPLADVAEEPLETVGTREMAEAH